MQSKRFKGTWLLAILLCVMPVLGQTPATLNLDFTADVQSDGVPTNITPDASLPPAMQAMVRKRVAEWRYSMPTWQGEPVAETIYGRIVAETVSVASGGFALRIKLISYRHAIHDERMVPPDYPQVLRQRGIGGVLVYSYKVGQNGTPQEIDLVSPVNPDRTSRLLDTAGRAALAQWRLQPRKVNGKPVDCRVMLPMVFEIKSVWLNSKKAESGEGNTSSYRAAHPDICPDDPILLTEVAGSML